MSTAQPTKRPRVYLAGPDVFVANAKEIGESLKKVCAEAGLEGVFPLDAPIPPGLTPRGRAHTIFEENKILIRSCQGVLANLTPFRGPSVDVGTAWEVGFAHVLGLECVGYAGVRMGSGDAMATYVSRVKPDGYLIEDFGLTDNLMVSCSCECFGSPEIAALRLASRLGVAR